jgi:hypothetical protein
VPVGCQEIGKQVAAVAVVFDYEHGRHARMSGYWRVNPKSTSVSW